jgi:alkylated DNA repair dioxygenase AlkB
VAQLPLFDSGDSLPPAAGEAAVLADDERGRIEYRPRLVDAGTARAWFDELRQAVAWKAERRRMYDREVDVPRLTAHFRLAGGEPPPPAIVQAARRVVGATGMPFNAVGLNLYRDGRDSVAPHNDHLNEIVEGHAIGLLSLGAIRRMTIRAKDAPRRVLHVDLEPGSLLLMSYATQLHYTHGVPKTRAAVGERISLAFRVKPDRAESGADRYR